MCRRKTFDCVNKNHQPCVCECREPKSTHSGWRHRNDSTYHLRAFACKLPCLAVGTPAPTRIAGPPLQLRSQPPVVASAAGLLCLEQGLILAEILVRLQRSNHFLQHWTHVALVHGTHQASRINILRLLCLASAAARTVVTNRHRALFVALVELEQKSACLAAPARTLHVAPFVSGSSPASLPLLEGGGTVLS